MDIYGYFKCPNCNSVMGKLASEPEENFETDEISEHIIGVHEKISRPQCTESCEFQDDWTCWHKGSITIEDKKCISFKEK